MNPRLILASTSPYRAELLARLQLPFDQQSPGTDETPRPDESPADLACRLATDKAMSVAQRHPDAVVIGSDQVLSLGTTTLGKPGDLPGARAQLARLAGRDAEFLTAVHLRRGDQGHTALDRTSVRFRRFSESEISDYLRLEPAINCAGSFQAESLGISLCDEIRSTDPTALIGLPLIAVCRMLRDLGVQVPPADRSRTP